MRTISVRVWVKRWTKLCGDERHQYAPSGSSLWNGIERHIGDATSHVNRMTIDSRQCVRAIRSLLAFYHFFSLTLNVCFHLVRRVAVTLPPPPPPLSSFGGLRSCCCYGFFSVSHFMCTAAIVFHMKFKCRQVVACSLSISDDYYLVGRAVARCAMAVCVCVDCARRQIRMPCHRLENWWVY